MNKNVKVLLIILLTLLLSIFLSACTSVSKQADSTQILKFKSGTYTATATGKEGPVKVEVAFDESSIKSIKVLENNETVGYGDKAIAKLPEALVEKQSFSVDVISGATLTSRAIFNAVADCIKQAGEDPKKLGFIDSKETSESQTFTIVGLSKDEIVLSGEELKSMEIVERKAVSIDSKGEKSETIAKGVLLSSILEKYNASLDQYNSIVTTASDGYSIEIPSDILHKRDIVIAYEINGEPVDLRIVVPDERAMYWLKFLTKLELMSEIKTSEATKAIILETAVKQLKPENYKYYDSQDKAVSIDSILKKYITDTPDFVQLVAGDMKKNEKYSIFSKQYIKISGEESPLFIGPDLPEGMRVKNLIYAKVGTQTLFSIGATKGILTEKSINDVTGVTLTSALEYMGFGKADGYTFTGIDGYSVRIDAKDIDKGVLFPDGDAVTVKFVGLDSKTTVKQLLTIDTK